MDFFKNLVSNINPNASAQTQSLQNFSDRFVPQSAPTQPLTGGEQQFNAPIGPTPQPTNQPTPVAPAAPVNQVSPDFLAALNKGLQLRREQDSAKNALTNNEDFTVGVPDRIPPEALGESGGRDKLSQVRDQLASRLLSQFEGDDELTALRKRAADTQIKREKRREELAKNTEGKLEGALNQELAQFDQETEELLGNLALQEQALSGRTKEISDMIDTVAKIQQLTGDEQVGSLQQDPVTGEVIGFFRNADTGEIGQKVVGQISPDQNLTGEIKQYQDAIKLGLIPESTTLQQFVAQMSAAGRKPDDDKSTNILSRDAFRVAMEEQALQSLPPETVDKAYETYVREQVFTGGRADFTETEYKKLAGAGLLTADFQSQLDFLYSSPDTIDNPFE